MFRKPIVGTVAENLKTWGTDGLRRRPPAPTLRGGDEIRARPAGDARQRGESGRTADCVWCWDCRRQVEPDLTELASRYGAQTVLDGY